MADSIRIRARHRNDRTEVMILALHPMETGLRSGAQGGMIPAHHITGLTVRHVERVVLEVTMSIAVSRDPLLSFRFRGGKPGDRIHVSWVDNLGGHGSGSGTIV
jgi:sulfur-oxidizing protein SoxZ